LQPGEYRRYGPAFAADFNRDFRRQDAPQVFEQSTAGDVGDAMNNLLDGVVIQNLANGPSVEPRRFKYGFDHGLHQGFDVVVHFEFSNVEDNFSDDTITVGVEAVGCGSQNGISG